MSDGSDPNELEREFQRRYKQTLEAQMVGLYDAITELGKAVVSEVKRAVKYMKGIRFT